MKKAILSIAAAALFSVSVSAAPGDIYANDGTYLGNTGSRYDANSVNNPYGRYGSKYSSESINNEYGTYGSKYSSQSPYNPYSSNAPTLYHNGQKRTVTVNPYGGTNRINPYQLKSCCK